MYDIFSSKSVKLGFMPMAKELALRNHTVYIVSPIKGNKPITYFNNVVTLHISRLFPRSFGTKKTIA